MPTAQLDILINSSDVPNAKRQLDSLAKSGDTTSSSMAALTTKVAGLLSVSAGFSKLVSVSRQFDQMNAGLVTMTGSTESAALAFAELEKFASKTPYTLDQSVQAFTKLVSLGLEPSQAAIESYGNTAAAMGKDLNQMIEAVADAATGEFERLKEFGIKARQQGDNVSFTFQGVTTTVKKNATEIENYLQTIGNVNFAGAMSNRMATLDGALSNLQDSWDGLFRAISQAGTGEVIEDSVRVAISALDELNDSISSGQTMAYIDAWGGAWGQTFDDVANMLESMDQYFSDSMESWGGEAKSTSQFMSDAFWEFPANIRALIQIATTHIAGFVDKAKAYGAAAAEALNPFSDGGWSVNLQLELAAIDHNVATLSASYLEQRNAAVSSLNDQTEAARNLREEYDKRRQKSGIDLGSFTKAGDSKDGESGVDKESERLAKKLQKEQEAEAKALEIKRKAADDWLYDVQAYQLSESQMVDRWYSEQLVKLQEYNALRPDMAQQANEALIALEEEKARRLMEIDTKVTEHNKAEIEKQKQSQLQASNLMVQHTQMTTGLMTDLLQNSGDQNSSLMQGLLAAQKAFAIPSIMVSTQVAAAAAREHSTLMGGLLAGETAAKLIEAQGAISVGIVAGQAIGGFAGAFDKGGNIPSGQWGIVGENGPEIVQGPMNVTSRKKTAAMAASAMSGGSGGGGTVINNITQHINGSGDEALARATKEATKQALVEVQRDAATNGPIRRTLGV